MKNSNANGPLNVRPRGLVRNCFRPLPTGKSLVSSVKPFCQLFPSTLWPSATPFWATQFTQERHGMNTFMHFLRVQAFPFLDIKKKSNFSKAISSKPKLQKWTWRWRALFRADSLYWWSSIKRVNRNNLLRHQQQRHNICHAAANALPREWQSWALSGFPQAIWKGIKRRRIEEIWIIN